MSVGRISTHNSHEVTRNNVMLWMLRDACSDEVPKSQYLAVLALRGTISLTDAKSFHPKRISAFAPNMHITSRRNLFPLTSIRYIRYIRYVMKTIEIEDTVYSALEQRIQRFGEKPNDVIRRILADTDRQKANGNGAVSAKRPTVEHSPLLDFVESAEYRRGKAKDRYFQVLRFIYQANPQQFEKLEGFRKGSRIQISKNATEISQSGRHTNPQRLDGTPFWVMTNLSNERKQTLLRDIMQFLGYTEQTIDAVVKTITSRY